MRSYYVGSDETQVVVLNLASGTIIQKRNQEIQDMLEHPSTISSSSTCVSTSVIAKKSLVPTVLYF